MGGGGGGGYFRSEPEKILKNLRDAEEKSHSEAHEAAVASYLTGRLSEFNDRDKEGVQRHLARALGLLQRQRLLPRLDAVGGRLLRAPG